MLVPFFLRGELDGEAGLDRCAESFRPLCAEAASAGVTLCYEGTLPAREILRLAERVGSSAFGCYFDLANPLAAGLDPPTELRELGEIVRRVHFKESRTLRGDTRPGLGRVDYAECALALAEIGYDGWLVLETPAAPPALVARDLSYARTHFPALEQAADVAASSARSRTTSTPAGPASPRGAASSAWRRCSSRATGSTSASRARTSPRRSTSPPSARTGT